VELLGEAVSGSVPVRCEQYSHREQGCAAGDGEPLDPVGVSEQGSGIEEGDQCCWQRCLEAEPEAAGGASARGIPDAGVRRLRLRGRFGVLGLHSGLLGEAIFAAGSPACGYEGS